MLGWMYLVTVALFYFAKGRGYYTAGAYPMLLAMGAAGAEVAGFQAAALGGAR
jgi:hypothetical protein